MDINTGIKLIGNYVIEDEIDESNLSQQSFKCRLTVEQTVYNIYRYVVEMIIMYIRISMHK